MLRLGIAHAVIAALFLPGPAAAAELIDDGRFEEAHDTFWASDGLTLLRESGRLCVEVQSGGEAWGQLIGVNGLKLEPGRVYRLSLTVATKPARAVPARVQRAADPWTATAEFTVAGSASGTSLPVEFEALEPEEAQLVFPLGGTEGGQVCLDDVSLVATGAPSRAAKRATEGPVIRVNQLGYLTDGPKRATFVAEAKRPIDFQLLDSRNRIVGKGKTQPHGFDPTAGVETQIADFSAFATPGDGYRLVSGDWASDRFSIGDDLYGRLRVDALSWFYPQRSGIAIQGAIAGKAYARPAGHVGIAPNQGDKAVPCLNGAQAETLYGDWSCPYQLDVTGGWYDAGDHGKYVVTGALSAAQLLAAYERGLAFSEGSPVIRDGLSRIPEAGNGVPDILDEARWELEFLLRMMVPDGEPLAGMVHHKIHDTGWTVAPMLPGDDPQPRALHRPSTAATLDVAAVAAQGARVFAEENPTFSARLLAAARKAWVAANSNPPLFAPTSDGLMGGGDYDDDSISDELFWAATELYLTTGNREYLRTLRASPLWTADTLSPAGAFDWRNVAGFARLQLALYGKSLPMADREKLRNSVLSAAQHLLSLQQADPFGIVYRPQDRRYDWGSNQLMLQNIVMLSAAFDLSGDRAFLNGAREGMDYILGRNALGLSYVTGYGTRSPQNQHSRWYARQRDPTLPNPPVGSLAGGPNSTIVDDIARAHLRGCPPQTCYIDDIEAYGSNEIAINWNAPLVYVASFLADAR
ncbi:MULTISPECIES: glycoside hydrolase family 9 protein [unclassified Ensifer]|uniref:glycoside hydrolase family 9 protein n=1 Tax=unclassified Ensifer TaxID=2633371 RepID=UPI0008131449|nr:MULTISPECIES: glycoside hydrolase family 9 protein [unclassified Ensifer]OCP09157.1 endoglucanase [Ensifer sp. LC13]OCP10345.1 endoglucanase [Ensifer sp. LC11]OCP14054.1 endoglucanase [Ensifer sp. LC14]OCP32403.1 endoglucanase [Ensifer sp. LC499]